MEADGNPPKSTRPVPKRWSSSSGDDMDGNDVRDNTRATGGGWDSSSDEGAGGSGWRGGIGMREFERDSAENTRRALLENDAELCQPRDPQEFKGGLNSGSDEGGNGCPARPRFVPGDPFANEEADTQDWARHFTYLSILPSRSVSSRSLQAGREQDNRGVGCDDKALRPVLDLPGGVAAGDGAGGVEEEVVLASHGIYEEYLAYDCRPPEDEGQQEWREKGNLWTDSSAAESERFREPRATARLSTPQRAVREEIMDRLFDELWERLTPDLLRLAAKKGAHRSSAQEASERHGFVSAGSVAAQEGSSGLGISGAGLHKSIVGEAMDL